MVGGLPFMLAPLFPPLYRQILVNLDGSQGEWPKKNKF